MFLVIELQQNTKTIFSYRIHTLTIIESAHTKYNFVFYFMFVTEYRQNTYVLCSLFNFFYVFCIFIFVILYHIFFFYMFLGNKKWKVIIRFLPHLGILIYNRMAQVLPHLSLLGLLHLVQVVEF